MNELLKLDKDFVQFYEKNKQRKPKLNDEELMATYIKTLENKTPPKPLSRSRASNCYRISPHIIKKVFLPNTKDRITWEIQALKKLEKYSHFPKVLLVDLSDPNHKAFYMNDVGVQLRSI